MKEREVLQILGKVGAIIEGHFVLASGQHSRFYINKKRIFDEPEDLVLLARHLANQFVMDNIQTIIGTGDSGVRLAQEVAGQLEKLTKTKISSIPAEKKDDDFVILPEYHKFVSGRKVLVVDDILTTGGSARKVILAIREARGFVVGLGVLCNRGGVRSRDVANVLNLISLVNLKLEMWNAGGCPLCASKIPIDQNVGHGREFLELLARKG